MRVPSPLRTRPTSLIAVGVVLLLLASSAGVGGGGSPAGRGASTAAPAPVRSPNAPTGGRTAGTLPGLDPAAEAPVPSPTALEEAVRGLPPPPVVRGGAANGTPHLGAAVAGPRPAGNGTGWFTGTVVNASRTTETLSGVFVVALPDSAPDPCTAQQCGNGGTSSGGAFNVSCGAGPDFLVASVAFYAQNLTYATCVAGSSVSLGTIPLLPDGYAVGIVRGDVNGTPALGNISVTGETRGGAEVASPSAETANGSGAFRVPVPPQLAAEVTFSQIGSGYVSNFTWVTVSSGATVDLGTIFLEPAPQVTVRTTLVDAVTGQPIAPVPGAPVELLLCSSLTKACGQQANSNSSTVEATGASGESYVIAKAPGYLDNVTPVGNLLPGPPSAPRCVPSGCRIELVPLGEITGTIGISGDPAALFDRARASEDTVEVTARTLGGYWTDANCTTPPGPLCNPTLGTRQIGVQSEVGGSFTLPAFPLWDAVTAIPGANGGVGPLPTIGNWTDVNVTPDEITDLGPFDLTPGTYIEGHVYVQGTTEAPPGGFQVSVVSRVNEELTPYDVLPSYTGNGSFANCTGNASGPAGGPGSFCVAAPPGPDQLSIGADDGLYGANETWVEVPYRVCCVRAASPNGSVGPFSLAEVTDPSVGSINLTLLPTAPVSGSIVDAAGGTGIPFAGVSVCSAVGATSTPCVGATANATGAFRVSGAPLGWDVVMGEAPTWQSNSEWVDLSAAGLSAPPLPLTPDGLLAGAVEVAGGQPALGAEVTACPISDVAACGLPLGPGVTNLNGQYEGYVSGSGPPEGIYMVEAVAPGYGSAFTFVNASAGNVTTVPLLTLQPTGGGAAAPGPLRPTVRLAGSGGSVWLTGRIVDPSTGLGVPGATVLACPQGPTATSCPSPLAGGTNSGGFFNFSVPGGLYDLSISALSYLSASVSANATRSPVSSTGTIDLAEIPWIWGNVTASPWSKIWVYQGTSEVPIVLAPAATIMICPAGPGGCSGSAVVNETVGTGGEFRVLGGVGGRYVLTAQAPLFDEEILPINLTTGALGLPPAEWPRLPIWTAVYGFVGSAASADRSGTSFATPASWANVAPTNRIPPPAGTGVPAGAPVIANAAGAFVGFVPSGGSTTTANVSVLDPNQYYPETVPIPVVLGAGGNVTYYVGPIGLSGYGWAEAQLVNSQTGAPVTTPVAVSAHCYDPSTGLDGTTGGLSDADGFVNLSAPAGSRVTFSFLPSGQLNGTALEAPVTAGATTWLGGNGSGATSIPLESAGYLASSSVNYSSGPDAPGSIFDAATGRPVAGAVVNVASDDPSIPAGGSYPSNARGQFLSAGPLGSADRLSVSAQGYVPASTGPISITPGNVTVAPSIDLSADGIVAGQVETEPGGGPAVGATVLACPSAGPLSCVSGTTNGSGAFWISVPPGPTTLTASLPGFVENASLTASAASDGWVWAGTLTLLGDSLVEGTVRGLPTGLPLAGANASLCSPLGSPTGPCDFSAITGASGQFALYAVPGSFVLALSAPGYNASYAELAVPGGTVVDLGSVFLQADGVVEGVVARLGTGAPIPQAHVVACLEATAGECGAPATTAADGDYAVPAPPGRVVIEASATGFEPGAIAVTVPSGGTVVAPALNLTPVYGFGPFSLSGRVVSEENASRGIGAASVRLLAGPRVAAEGATNGTGYFLISAAGADYTLEVTAAGAIPYQGTLSLDSNRSGITIALSAWTWPVSLRVVDGLTRTAVSGASVELGSAAIAVANGLGVAILDLANGSYPLSVVPPAGSGDVASVVVLLVNGTAVVRTFDLYPASAVLLGEIRTAGTGQPIAGANVSVEGTAADGAAVAVGTVSAAGGGWTVSAYAGSYRLAVSAVGYRSLAVSVEPNGGVDRINLSLLLANASAPASSGPAEALYLVGGGSAAAALALAIWGFRPRRPAAEPGRSAAEGPGSIDGPSGEE